MRQPSLICNICHYHLQYTFGEPQMVGLNPAGRIGYEYENMKTCRPEDAAVHICFMCLKGLFTNDEVKKACGI